MNLFWFCNDCSNIAIQNLKISRRLDSLEQKTNDVLEQTKECFSVVKTLYDRAPNASVQKWSDVVKAKRPPLIIKPKNSSQNSVKTKLDVTNKVDPSQINIAGVRNTANGGIQIECENDESMQKLHEAARNALADRYEIQIPEFKKPKIVIVGVYDKYLREIDIFINKLKDMCGTSEITFVRKYKPRRKEHFNVLLEVSNEAFNYFIAQKKLRFGWDSFLLYEFVSVLRCFKCWKYGHMANLCKQEQFTCPLCAGNHKADQCTSSNKRCSNCEYISNVLKIKNIEYNHTVFDRNCTSYLRQVEKTRLKTKYE
ncbi:unnamed protein product [Acanthoscelides obtectus]|uniref:CCHC-type domain-containing protein n=1 Tax=Acanthoscelides obtectus TaxID=200917 RepID=A0A9P0K4E6_ACAOB|nr:unnamed protein product [Acanthoscelides obtectus]CAK1653200.1 hypothetical protein AOBTE_LOCUS18121 [Acanthoscelides obtectus]